METVRDGDVMRFEGVRKLRVKEGAPTQVKPPRDTNARTCSLRKAS